MSYRSINCLEYQDELGMSVIEEETGVTNVISPWVCHCGYVCIDVCVCACMWVAVLGILP